MSDLVFMGPPGGGKGTVGKLLQRAGLADHVSTGELIRTYLTTLPADDPLNERIAAGHFLSDDEITALLIRHVDNVDRRIIFDGYPRNLEQITLLIRILERAERTLHAAILFELPDEQVIDRISGRYNCQTCKTVYHRLFNPAPDNRCVCGSTSFETRSDDRAEVVAARLARYHQVTEPMIDRFENMRLLRVVNADQSVEAVMKEVMIAAS